ncbi:MAG: hypothetical protein JRN02_07335 [Nitrososphaerota archaeon]|nr:hypothetical protein [Nitrososphaerota archaeon]
MFSYSPVLAHYNKQRGRESARSWVDAHDITEDGIRASGDVDDAVQTSHRSAWAERRSRVVDRGAEDCVAPNDDTLRAADTGTFTNQSGIHGTGGVVITTNYQAQRRHTGGQNSMAVTINRDNVTAGHTAGTSGDARDSGVKIERAIIRPATDNFHGVVENWPIINSSHISNSFL